MVEPKNFDKKETREARVAAMMTWVRLLLPLAIAALGWYIGQTVGNLNQRLTNLEVEDQALRLEFIEHKTQSDQRHADIERRLSKDEKFISDKLNVERFIESQNEINRRIERLEDRLDGMNQNGN
jgi:hypothetical protein